MQCPAGVDFRGPAAEACRATPGNKWLPVSLLVSATHCELVELVANTVIFCAPLQLVQLSDAVESDRQTKVRQIQKKGEREKKKRKRKGKRN